MSSTTMMTVRFAGFHLLPRSATSKADTARYLSARTITAELSLKRTADIPLWGHQQFCQQVLTWSENTSFKARIDLQCEDLCLFGSKFLIGQHPRGAKFAKLFELCQLLLSDIDGGC